jgi:hypothetical protein
MATVPVYDQPQVSPNVGQLPAFQAPGVEPMRDFAGKQIEEGGQAQTNLGANLMRIAEKQKELEDQSQLDQSEIDLRTFIVDFTKENNDSVGEKATGLTEKFTTSYYKRVSEFVTTFAKDGQRDSRLVKRFQNKANEIGLATIAKFSTYEADQKQQVRVNNNKALGKMLSNTASNSPFEVEDGKVYDGLRFENSKKSLIENLKKRADLMGYGEDSDAYKQLVQEELSTVYMDRMANIINTNPTAAPAYFDKVKDFITNDEFKSKFKGMATKVAQEAEAEGWVETQFTDALKKKDGKQAIADLRLGIMKKYSGDQQKTALQVYEQLEQSLKTQNESIRKKFSNEAWSVVYESQTTWGTLPNTTKEWLRENDPDTYRSLEQYIETNVRQAKTEARYSKLEARERRREIREIEKDRREEKENIAFGELNEIMGNNPKEFMNMDLNNWRTKLSSEDWKYFNKKKTDFNLNPKEGKQATTLNDRINIEANILRIDKDKAKKARFEKNVINDVDAYIQKNKGQYPDATALNNIIKEANRTFVVKNWLGISTKISRINAPRAGTISDIPKPILDELNEQLKGKNVSDAAKVNIYNTYIGQPTND